MILSSDFLYTDPSDGSTILINGSSISLLTDFLEAIFSSDSLTDNFFYLATGSKGFSEV
jgi:hypothetical protein